MTSMSDLAIIASNLIRDGLDPLKLGILVEAADFGKTNVHDHYLELTRADHETLIYALQNHPAARNLQSRKRAVTLRHDLRSLFRTDLHNFVPSLEQVIKGSPYGKSLCNH